MRIHAPAAAVILLATLAACSSGGHNTAMPTTTTAHSDPTPDATAAGDGLTGFGATETAWAAHHTADPAAGGGWNADPSLPHTTTGAVNHTYTGVTFSGQPGRALLYEMLFTPRSLASAETRALAELPADAVAGKPVYDLSGMVGAQCIEVAYTSATLTRDLGGTKAGTVYVIFQSAQANHLDEGAIEWATFDDAAQDTAANPC